MREAQSGNVLIYILGAVFLIGILTVVVRGTSAPGAALGPEEMAIKASQVQQYAGELERAVGYILKNGQSETDIRFAATNAASVYGSIVTDTPMSRQVFHRDGGGAGYRLPPERINDGTKWQFYARTHIPDMGTDTASTKKSEIIAVLPNVTDAFCARINELNDQTLTLTDPHDPSATGCIHAGEASGFAGTFVDGAGSNTLTGTFFTHLPAKQACVRCQGGNLHFYHVLMTR